MKKAVRNFRRPLSWNVIPIGVWEETFNILKCHGKTLFTSGVFDGLCDEPFIWYIQNLTDDRYIFSVPCGRNVPSDRRTHLEAVLCTCIVNFLSMIRIFPVTMPLVI
jgi:hypothetical protein